MNTLTHSCGAVLSSKDKYCTACGEQTDFSFKTMQIPEYKPDIFQLLGTHYTNAEIFTGYVTETYHYQRIPSGDTNKEYSYWLLTLDNGQGEKKQINTHAEDELYDSVKTGDIITVCRPTPLSISHKIKYSADTKRVQTNDLSGVTIFYKNDGVTSMMNLTYQPDPFSRAPAVFTALLCLFIVWLSLGTSIVSAAIGAVAGVGVGYLVFRITKKIHLQDQAALQALEAFMAALRNISAAALGFDRHQRAKSDDDVLCPHCQHRNPANYRYCAECGSSAPLLLIDCSADTSAQSTSEQSSDDAVAQVRPQGVKDLRLQILAQHELGASFELTIKRLFRPALPAKGHRTVKMFRVVDRNVGSSVRSWTEQQTYYTDHHYSSGRYSHTSRSVSYTHYRTSGLSGKLWVEDSAGEMSEIHVPQSILKGTDVGDYILCGWSELASSKKIHHSAMICAMNLNKDLQYIGDEMTDLNFIDNTAGHAFNLIIPVAAAAGWFTGSWQVALISWGVMATAIFLLKAVKNSANDNSLAAQERPIWELRNAVRQQSSALLEKLMALG